jgi:DDE superfamily endonuclease/helix-turn-helix, Psq domain
MPTTSKEAGIILALQALQNNKNLSERAAAKIYGVDRRTLARRRAGKLARHDITPKSRKLTGLEEETIVQYIVELCARAFPPRLSGVEDMANQLLRVRDAPPVGKLWAHRFVQRKEELRTRWSRGYDYQRAKCEDPKVIGEWFTLVRNVKAKYGIVDDDVYNFDETGFMMGIICAGMVVTTSDGRGKAKLAQPGNREWATVIQGVNALGWAIPPFIILAAQYHLANWYTECNLPADWRIATTDNGWTTNAVGLDWIKHFDLHTAPRTKGKYRLLILDGHESHHSTEFERYCQQNNIITLCMPPHSSHLLQPLDVGCFGPLKQAYGRQIEHLMRMHINHVSKLEFLCAFREAFFASMTEKNIRGGFTGAGLVPFDPERVLSKLDVRLHTPTPLNSRAGTPQPWVFQTPQNPREADSQSTLIKTRIANHQNSSPTSMLAAVDQLAKSTTAVMHQVALLRAENASLRKANEALSKRRRAKRTRVQLGGSLTLQDAMDLLGQSTMGGEGVQETQLDGSGAGGGRTKVRCCGVCGKPGHNARTCQEAAEASDSAASDVIIVGS